MRKNLLPGIVLILAGLYLLIDQFVPLSYGFGVAFVGLALLSVRMVRGPRGFTIAGSIVLLSGLAMALADMELLSRDLTAVAVVGLLAVSFFLMHILDYQRLGHWPIIPGLCLLGVAVLVYFYGYDRLPSTLWGWIRQFWPVALICAGAATLAGVMGNSRRNRQRRAQQQAEQNWQQTNAYAPPPQNGQPYGTPSQQTNASGWQPGDTQQYPPNPPQPDPAAQPAPSPAQEPASQPWVQQDAPPAQQAPSAQTPDNTEATTGQPYGGPIEAETTADKASDAPIILGAPPTSEEEQP